MIDSHRPGHQASVTAEHVTMDDPENPGWIKRETTGWIVLICSCGTFIRGRREEVGDVVRRHVIPEKNTE